MPSHGWSSRLVPAQNSLDLERADNRSGLHRRIRHPEFAVVDLEKPNNYAASREEAQTHSDGGPRILRQTLELTHSRVAFHSSWKSRDRSIQ